VQVAHASLVHGPGAIAVDNVSCGQLKRARAERGSQAWDLFAASAGDRDYQFGPRAKPSSGQIA